MTTVLDLRKAYCKRITTFSKQHCSDFPHDYHDIFITAQCLLLDKDRSAVLLTEM